MKKIKGNSSQKQNEKIPSYDEVEITKYGNSKKIPHGWIITNAPDFKLEAIGVKSIKAIKEWPGSIFTNSFPVIVTCYHPDDKAKVNRAEKSGKLIPTFKEVCDYNLGGYKGVPYGWEVTPLTITQLRKINVSWVKGWVEDGRKTRRARCHHPKDRAAVLSYQPKERPFYYRKRPVDTYAEYMTDDSEMQYKIIQEYDNNKNTKGTAWRLLSDGYQEKNKEIMWDAYKMMKGARIRHECTNYEDLLRSGMDRYTANALKTHYPSNE